MKGEFIRIDLSKSLMLMFVFGSIIAGLILK